MADIDVLKTQIAALLSDSTNALWTATEIQTAIEITLPIIDAASPRIVQQVVDVVAADRQYSLAALTYAVTLILDVQFPYNETDDTPPSIPCHWTLLDADTIYLYPGDAPAAGEHIRFLYQTPHTIQGLSAATATTLNNQERLALLLGAQAAAAALRANALVNTVTISGWTPKQYADWSAARSAELASLLTTLRHRASHRTDSRVSPGLPRLVSPEDALP